MTVPGPEQVKQVPWAEDTGDRVIREGAPCVTAHGGHRTPPEASCALARRPRQSDLGRV